MEFAFSDEQRMLSDAVTKTFASAKAAKGSADHTAVGARARWQQFVDLGLFDLAVEHGADSFGSVVDWALVLEAAGEAMVLEPLAANLVGRELLAAAGADRAVQMRSQVANGDEIVAICPIGWQGASPELIDVKRTPQGWRARADHCFCLGAGLADHLLLIAESPEIDGKGLYAISRASGAPASGPLLIDGSWGGYVDLADEAEYLGAIAAADLRRILALGRLASCAEMVGVMASAISYVASYLQTRVQFDKPLAEQQALQHQLADIVVATDLGRSYVQLGLAEYQSGAPDEMPAMISDIYRVVGEVALTACERAIQLHGGMGMTEEHPIGGHLKRVMVLAAQYGPD